MSNEQKTAINGNFFKDPSVPGGWTMIREGEYLRQFVSRSTDIVTSDGNTILTFDDSNMLSNVKVRQEDGGFDNVDKVTLDLTDPRLSSLVIYRPGYPEFRSTRKVNPGVCIVPVRNKETEHLFAEGSETYDKHVTDIGGPPTDVSVPTGFLKPNVLINLLNISHTPELAEKGLIDQTDTIDTDVHLSVILFSYELDGVLTYHPYHLAAENYGLKYTPSDHNPDATLVIGSTIFCDCIRDADMSIIKVAVRGHINCMDGTCFVEFSDPELSGKHEGNLSEIKNVKVLGYMLDAKRVNVNRLPKEKEEDRGNANHNDHVQS